MTAARIAWTLWGVAIFTALLSLGVGTTLDDYMHAQMVTDGSVFTLYDFFGHLFETGTGADPRYAGNLLPWWTDDGFSLRFCRPLGSLVLFVDHQYLDAGGVLSHAHGLVWFAVLLFVAHRTLVALFDAETAKLAIAFYAVASWHAVPLAFTAARHTHVTATFALLALYVFARTFPRGSLGGRAQLLGSLLFSLCCGESALLVVPMMLGWGIAMGKRLGLSRGAVWGRLLLPIVVAGGYVLWYVASGYGAERSGTYQSPLSLDFLAGLPGRWLALIADLLGSLANDVTLFGLLPAQVAWGLVALAFAVAALRWLGRHDPDTARPIIGLLVGALLSAVPASAAMPGGRALTIPGIAAAALFGALVQRATQLRPGRQRRLLLIGCLSCGVGLHPLFRGVIPVDFRRQGSELIAWSKQLSRHCEGKLALGVRVLDPSATYPMHVLAELSLPRPQALHVLTMSDQAHRLERLADRRYALHVDGDFFEQPWSRTQRARPLVPGEQVSVEGLRISVERAAPSTELRLRLQPGAEVCWFTSTEQGLQLVDYEKLAGK